MLIQCKSFAYNSYPSPDKAGISYGSEIIWHFILFPRSQLVASYL